jgi:catechol 2,3-dioxygenase-like lactoylglutathione lyase family enzyme
MLANSKAFSGFAVKDLEEARAFYGDTLGLETSEENGLLTLHLAGDRATILNFPVPDIGAAVDGLVARGVEFERYDGFEQDEKGIARAGGPPIAWFTDPSGNILSVLEM